MCNLLFQKHRLNYDDVIYELTLSRIFLIDFLKILSLAQKNFRNFEEEMLAPFLRLWIWHRRERASGEATLNSLIEKFKSTIMGLKSDIMATANPSDLSRATECLLSAAMSDTESSVTNEKTDCPFCFPEKEHVINDLRKCKLTSSEYLYRCRRLRAFTGSPHHEDCHFKELEREEEALNAMCQDLTSACTNLAHQLFAICSDSTRTMLQRIANFMEWYICEMTYGIYFNSSIPGDPGSYDCLGRTTAHHFFDVSNLAANNEYRFWESLLTALIKSYSETYDEQDFLGRTILHIACQKQLDEVVQWLLAEGADPGLVTVHGHSPLHYAAAKGCNRICARLLDLLPPKEIDRQDSNGYSARDYAETYGFDEISDLIDKAANGNDDELTTSSLEDHGSQEGTHQSQRATNDGGPWDISIL